MNVALIQPRKPLRNRVALAHFLWCREYRVGAEVGVYQGAYSDTLLRRVGVQTLYMIDAWDGTGMKRPYDGDAMYADVCRRFKTFGRRVKIIREHSPQAADRFKHDSLDFVYIDADHSYAAVYNDIVAWYRKVRPGGILCGHDYVNSKHKQVKRAVDEIFGDRVNSTAHCCGDWWVDVDE